jgi:hypothetical protein
MQTVEDEEGRRYLLERRSEDTSRVLDLETGQRRYLPNDRLSAVSGESPLIEAAGQIPAPLRDLITSVPDELALGLLVFLARNGAQSVKQLLSRTTLCESDLHGRLAILQTTGFIKPSTPSGERGYTLTEYGYEALKHCSIEDDTDPQPAADDQDEKPGRR